MPKRRVLIILPSYDAGGAENYALRLIEFAGTDKYEWHVTSGNLANRSLEGAFAAAGSQVHYASPGFANPIRVIRFYRFLRRHRFDAVMSLNGIFGGLSLTLALAARVPVRIGWHRRSTPAYRQTVGRRLYGGLSLALLEWASTRILSNSQAALDYFHGEHWRGSDRYAVIPNGVDAERFCSRPQMRLFKRKELGIAEDDWVIGHVGRVDPAKDHDTLFAIVKALRQTHPRVRLLLVGTSTDSDEIQARLEQHGLVEITLGLGVREDVHHLYNAMDVFVFPSVTEGQPNALIEAMLSGLPVVASDIEPIRALMPSALKSLLFQPSDVQGATKRITSHRQEAPFDNELLRQSVAAHHDLRTNLGLVLESLAHA